MPEYTDILTGYLNTRKDSDKKYLTIKNVSESAIVIEPGDKVYLNMIPKEVRDKHPKMPLFKMSKKLEDQVTDASAASDEDVPF